jgi:glycerol-3-phosphate dehydrogenase (NAD(P)+)
MSKNKRIVIIGAGAWGTALAIAISRSSHRVTLVARSHTHAHELNHYRENKTYLSGIPLDSKVEFTHETEVLKTADIILWVIPTQYSRQLIKEVKDFISPDVPFVICSKGIDCTHFPITQNSLLSVIISKLLTNPLAVLSGPNFAKEIAQGLPAAATLAAPQLERAQSLAEILSTPLFPLYPNDDIIGVQIAGAIKNVIAIASGILLGSQLGQNAQAALLSCGLQEIKNLGLAMGAKSETFFSLAGMGDFILTCTSTQSRNTSVGVALSQGQTLEQILASRNSISEGVYTAKAVQSLANHYQVAMPICETVYQLLEQKISLEAAIKNLYSQNSHQSKEAKIK